MLTKDRNRHKILDHLPWKMPALYLLSIVAIAAACWVAFCPSTSAQGLDILTPQEKLWLARHDGKIILAPTPNYPPVDFFDDKGRETGMAGDYIHLVERKLGFRFKVVQMKSWADIVQAAKAGRIDATSIAQRTPDRDKFWLFTRPYLTVSTVIISNNRIQGQLSLKSMGGLRVAIVKSYGISEYIAKKYPNLHLTPVPDDLTGLRRVSVGDLDAMIADLPTAAYFIEKEGIPNLRIAGDTGYAYHYSIASRKDLPILNRILDKGLAAITPEEKEAISDRWIGLRVVRPIDWRLAWFVTTLILAIVLATLIWNVALRRRVREQTGELTRANAELQESEARFRNMVQNIPGVVYQSRIEEDESVHFTYVSPRATELFGLSSDPSHPDWVLGSRIHPDDKKSFFESVKAAIENQAQWNYEGRLLLHDGSVRQIQGIASPTITGDQLVFDGILLDITERKQTEEMLVESEQRYRAVFDSTAYAFLLFDLDGTLVDVNARACEMYGYSHEEMVGMQGRGIVEPERWHLFEKFLQLKEGDWLHVESTEVRKDGSTFDSEVYGTKIHYLGKKLLLAVVSDITERNRSREAMKTYADIVHNMQSGLYVYHLEDPEDDHSLRLMDGNPASTAALGLVKEDVVGKYIDEVFPGLRERDIPARFAETAITGQPFSIDDFLYSDGTVHRRYFSFRVFALPGNRVGVLFEDTTEEKQAEIEKRQFYRDTISSVTDGKLLIVGKEDIEKYIRDAALTVDISSYEDTAIARRKFTNYFCQFKPSDSEFVLFMTGLGEAMTNAIKHAGRGTVFAGTQNTSLWVCVTDEGPGIAALAIPKATLKRGYSTKVSMGMGYSIMLEASDQIMLSTGPEGTAVVLIKNLMNHRPRITLKDLPDTW